MSTEATFAPLSFPPVGSGATTALAEAQARTRGHATGYAAGMRAAEEALRVGREAAAVELAAQLEAARQRTDALAALLTAAINGVNARVAPVLVDAQQTIAAASVDLAEAIIGVELADTATSARAAVSRALRDVDPAAVLVVRVHPATLAALDETIVAGVTFSADHTLVPGDALVDFADGYLDARIGTAVERARTALLDGPA